MLAISSEIPTPPSPQRYWSITTESALFIGIQNLTGLTTRRISSSVAKVTRAGNPRQFFCLTVQLGNNTAPAAQPTEANTPSTACELVSSYPSLSQRQMNCSTVPHRFSVFGGIASYFLGSRRKGQPFLARYSFWPVHQC